MTIALETASRPRYGVRRALVSLLQRGWTKIYRFYRCRVTERALGRLDDRMLKDIGLVRTDTGYDLVGRHDADQAQVRRLRG